MWMVALAFLSGWRKLAVPLAAIAVGVFVFGPGSTLIKALFDHDGFYCDGVFTTWLTLDDYLKAASIDERAHVAVSL
jgi:hypothetical protein